MLGPLLFLLYANDTANVSYVLSPEASFGIRVLSLPASVCARVSVCLCVSYEFVRAITRHPFKLESPNLEHRLVKVPIVFGGDRP